MQEGGADHKPAEQKDATKAMGEPHRVPLRLEEFLPYRLNVLASLVSQALSQTYAQRYGIGVAEWRVLVTLGQFPVMTGKAIGTHTHMHKTKVSRAVAMLESRKLLSRRSNRADMRESFVSLTPAGRAIYEALAPVALEFARKLTADLDASERAVFNDVLDRLTKTSATLVSRAAEVSGDTESTLRRRTDAEAEEPT
jgi:DNA-binding MarR family transcriptional regulator